MKFIQLKFIQLKFIGFRALGFISLFAGLFMLGSATATAGEFEPTFVTTADCESFTVHWGPSGFRGATEITVTIGTVPYFNTSVSGSSGTITEAIVPALTGVSDIVIAINIRAFSYRRSLTINVDCSDNAGFAIAANSGDYVPPCEDGRTTSNLCEPLAIYSLISDDGIGMIIYSTPRGVNVGTFALYIAAEDFDALPADIETSCVIAASDDNRVVAYLLPTGEIEVNHGPDEDGRVFIYRYTGFPSLPVIDATVSETALPAGPSCF